MGKLYLYLLLHVLGAVQEEMEMLLHVLGAVQEEIAAVQCS